MSATGSGGCGPGPGPTQGSGSGASNPRKFSEKIALHTQRQAEETAAFQEVMMDISSTRLQAQKLLLARSQGPYYGGSLPNVNQIGRTPQDFQGSFPSTLESNRSTRHHGLVERVQRDRRFISPVRPYRNRQVDSSQYNSAYLSPPPDPSWRRNWSGNFPGDKSQLYRLPTTALNRTNSDSALHTSVMNPTTGDPFMTGGPTLTPQGNRRSGDGEGRRMFPYPVPPIEEIMLDEGKLLKPWDNKKFPQLTSRPKSCEVPGINIFTSPEQPSTPAHGVPSALNTGGSLPDLSSLHFPSPLPTPLDQDEPGYPGSNSLSGGSSTGNLASTLTQLGINPGNTQGGNSNFHHTQDRSLRPVAHASGSHTLTLPNNSLVLRGSVTDGDQSEVHFLWVRDSQSPAAGDVLYGSDTQASLYLANLVEGTYLFQLRVSDAQGRSCSAMATVEVRPEPGGGEEVELEMLVSVSQVSVSQRDTVLRQLAALLHYLDGDIQVRALLGHSHLSTVLRFSVRGPSGPVSGSRIVSLLRNQLLREKSDYLLFRVLRVDTVLCQLQCSGRGQCDPITKECLCDPFWTENLIRLYLGDGESNCEWRVLYVILTSFMLMVLILSVSWTFICCCKRRRQTKVRKKTKYTILDNMDEQERVELRPKFSIKHRSTEHNSSLMMSESELDSDQDTIFSRDRPVCSRNRLCSQAARNGNAFG
ncbi:uncharacterized protein LOC117822676 [Notolabrus celidotus]|uniref:uncharacterized protein LOC117822676 n=1 Tax=Notolabrus celidotus TaxID=1203425 RepID=UPI0014900D51|nr:uncharacterized protein LOC117822676 [Notolabrus celidotus]